MYLQLLHLFIIFCNNYTVKNYVLIIIYLIISGVIILFYTLFIKNENLKKHFNRKLLKYNKLL